MKPKSQRADEMRVMDSLIEAGYEVSPCLPDPPDLIVNGEIGVEVRRLNQHYFHNGIPESVDHASQAFQRLVQRIIYEVPNPECQPSAMVSYVMHRPLLSTRENTLQIRNTLLDHLPHILQSRNYQLNRVDLNITPWFKPLGYRYFIGATHDGNRGGFILEMAHSNFPIALSEKEKDLLRYKNDFKECWLALIDEMYLWHDDYSVSELSATLKIESSFDRIILFSPVKLFAFTTLYQKNLS